MNPIEIIRSSTMIGAEIVRMPGKLGIIKVGAIADLIVVDGDPLKDLDLGLLQNQGQHLPIIMKGGSLHKERLS